MKVERFVMAYEVEQDRLRAILPGGFTSLRPVLRINAELRIDAAERIYIEFNTAAEAFGKRGWLNIGKWGSSDTDVSYETNGKTVTFKMPALEITFTKAGIEGGCPAEKDNDGTFYIISQTALLCPEDKINSNKEFCDCKFLWKFTENDAHGVSTGKTIPAFPTAPQKIYDELELTAENAALIPCRQVLGSYAVKFERGVPSR